MNQRPSRRDAIKFGLGAAVGACFVNHAVAQTRPAAPIFQAFVTDRSGRRHSRFDGVFNAGTGESTATFTIDLHQPLQTILGFGAALTEAACTMISQLTSVDRATLLDDLYSPTKSNFSIGRLCLGASDYSTELYSYDDGAPDPTLSRFSIDRDRVAVLPVVRQARAIRPDLFLFASPWSPPGWMKYGGSMKGGSIHPGNLQVYAQYVVRYLQAYAATGVLVDAMTIQNEIDADQAGAMPACTWSEEIEARYIADHLGPLLTKNDIHTELWILDHNYDLAGRVLDQLAKPNLRKYVNAVAWHGYSGSPEQMMLVQDKYPDLPMHWTEGGDDFDSPKLGSAWARWSKQFAGILSNGARSITTWNLALNEFGKPNIGPFSCGGLITIDSHSQEITRNGIFWALSHYSQAIMRGSRVLHCEPKGTGKITSVAARRPNGTLAIILTNSGPAAIVQVQNKNGLWQRLSLTEDSVTTVLIN